MFPDQNGIKNEWTKIVNKLYNEKYYEENVVFIHAVLYRMG